MITIKLPHKFFEEKKYVLDIFFKEYQNVELQYFKTDYPNCEIILKNGGKIIIEDHFFSNIKGDDYIKKEYLPDKISYFRSEFSKEKNVPTIFGKPKILKSKYKIVCCVDFISSSFFMLSRWEEILGSLDEHKRFCAKESYSYKNGFLNRPVVNEYLEILCNMISFLEKENPIETPIKRSNRKFNLIMTHDIDFFSKYASRGIIKKLSGDILKRHSISEFKENIKNYINVNLIKKTKDPYDKFETFMDFSESLGTKSIFFFMSGGNSKHDNKYNIKNSKVIKTIENILARGHFIGLHYSYNALHKDKLLDKEIKKISISSKKAITKGRSHFLRLPSKDVYEKLNNSMIKEDYSSGHASLVGFKHGFCYEFNPWNFKNREKYENIVEYPLIMMDTTLIDYLGLGRDKIEKVIVSLSSIIKKYKGNFVVLIHNSIEQELFEHIKEVFNLQAKWPR